MRAAPARSWIGPLAEGQGLTMFGRRTEPPPPSGRPPGEAARRPRPATCPRPRPRARRGATRPPPPGAGGARPARARPRRRAPRPEPEVKVAEKQRMLAKLRAEVMDRIDPAAAVELPPEALRKQLETLVHEVAERDRLELTAREQATLAEELAHDMVGYGPLEPLLRDESVTDIMVNGPNEVFVERRGLLAQDSNIQFRNAQQLATIAQKMAAGVGRRVDESSPLVDCRLADGSRVNVVFPPLAIDGACISIRKFSKKKIDFADDGRIRQLSPPMRAGAGDRRALPPEHRDLRRHRLGQDHPAERAQPARSTTASASSPSRTRPSCSSSSRTWCGWRPGRRTSRARARSPSATWSRTRCACAPTASSSARCAAPRRSTCCRP